MSSGTAGVSSWRGDEGLNARRGRGILASLSLDGAPSASSPPQPRASRVNRTFAAARARALTRGVAIAAAALATAATVSSAAGGLATDSRSRLTSVGSVTRTKGHVTVGRGIPVGRKADLRGGDLLSTGAGGEAKVTLKLKRFDCTVWSNTQIRVRPARSVGYQMVGRAGDIACGTLSRSRQTEIGRAHV